MCLELAYDIQEDALIIKGQVCQIVGELTEIIPDANFDVFAEMMIDGRDSAQISRIS